jgi:hypothetical protein
MPNISRFRANEQYITRRGGGSKDNRARQADERVKMGPQRLILVKIARQYGIKQVRLLRARFCRYY